MKKYELTNETIIIDGRRILYRIKAVKDFADVKKGELGGFVEREENLSHEGNCWIWHNAKVYGCAGVYDSAQLYENAEVYGSSRIYGKARVSGNARIYGGSIVRSNSMVYGAAEICGASKVCGNARIFGTARLRKQAWAGHYFEMDEGVHEGVKFE